MKHSSFSVTRSAMIATLYVLLTYFSALIGLDKGWIQFRVSELLCIFPLFFSEAIGGLTVGCFLANLLCGGSPLDLFFGTLATFLGGVGTYFFRRHRSIALFSPVLFNTLLLPVVLQFSYQLEQSIYLIGIGIFIGEFVICVLLGTPLSRLLEKRLKIE